MFRSFVGLEQEHKVTVESHDEPVIRQMGTTVLLDLMGGVALLWGLHMVRSGIMRAFGPNLQRLLSKALRNRLAAFGAGRGGALGHSSK